MHPEDIGIGFGILVAGATFVALLYTLRRSRNRRGGTNSDDRAPR
jgi:hypothetical protein